MGGTRENGEEGGHGTSPNPGAAQLIPPPVGACPTLSGSQASLSKSPVPQVPPSGLQDRGWALGRPTRPSTHIRALPRQHCSPAGLGTGVCEGER